MVAMKRRVILISHPDFDREGAEGIKAAVDQVKQYKEGNRAILNEVKKRGIRAEELKKFEEWIGKLEYLVRHVEV
jgi:hypothetical protein